MARHARLEAGPGEARVIRDILSGRPGGREELLEALRELRRPVPDDVARRGRSYVVGAAPLRMEGEGRVQARVEGSAPEPYLVFVEPFPPGDEAPQGGCTCPYARRTGPCKHFWAVLERIEGLVEAVGKPADQEAPGPEEGPPPASGGVEEGEGDGGEDEPAWAGAIERLDRAVARSRETIDDEPAGEVEVVSWRIDLSRQPPVVHPFVGFEQPDGTIQGESPLYLDDLAYSHDLHDRPEVARVAARLRDLDSRKSIAGFTSFRDAPGLLHLADSPHVARLDDPDRPVDVRRGEVTLYVAPGGDGGVGLRVALGPWLVPEAAYLAEDSIIVLRDPGKDRVHVGEVPDPVRPVVEAVVGDGVGVPVAGRSLLLERAARLGSVLPLRIHEALDRGTAEADARPHLLCQPEGEGMRLAVRVRPAPGAELHRPGEGPASLHAVRDGGLVEIERRTTLERAGVDRVVEELGLADQPEVGDLVWTLAGDEALETLARLEELADDEDGPVVEWAEGAPRLVGRASPSALRVEIRERRDWFGVSGGLELDGARVGMARLLGAVRKDRPFVRVEGNRWVRIADDLRDRLAALDEVSHESGGEVRVGRPAAPVVDEALADAGRVDLDEAWVDLTRRLREAEEVSTEPPDELEADLRPYQARGYAWLKRLATWGVGGILADDMGLGKTVQTLGLLCDRAAEGPALVVCPTSVEAGWLGEMDRFAPGLDPVRYRATPREGPPEVGPGQVVVASYALARIDADLLAEVEWATLVLDEAQKIKNSQTKTHQALRRVEAGWRVALTGTPLENHLGELWSIFRVIEPGLLGPWAAFERRFAAPIERAGDPERREALSRVLEPFILRRTKEEVLPELPPCEEVRVDLELSGSEQVLYDAHRVDALARIEESGGSGGNGDARFAILAALTRLRQLACHPGLVDPSWSGSSTKVEALVDRLTELGEEGRRALVFSQFTSFLDIVEGALDRAGVDHLRLDGSTPGHRRGDLVDAFQAGEADAFLISLRAGGQGLNLTAADVVFHLDPWWNPAVEDQATDRTHRIGQTRAVSVYRLVAAGTIEEEILALHAEKRDLVEGVLDGTDRAGRLSTEELLGLLRTSGREAAGGEGPTPERPDPRPTRALLGPGRASGEPREAGSPAGRIADEEIPALIRDLRAERGLSQADLAARIGVTGPTISNWERGRHRPSDANLARLLALAGEGSPSAEPV